MEKRACRRLEAAAQERGCPQVKAHVPASWGSEEPESLDTQPRGHLPALRADGSQGRPGSSGRWKELGPALPKVHCGGVCTSPTPSVCAVNPGSSRHRRRPRFRNTPARRSPAWVPSPVL
ncbi:uncharacterized protein C10orf143 homolog isoform X2 [Hippopotamus amphibius kiboko]|uniref:uncharacterized protein C10orf143 homolog isoform X2 n=1 Tax=Hippopotamus amphibius kiboko TaxID=575201 RepID=UPI00259AD547|nr:uncharacterized protein C10orf143 homolog isoform X2 [Hippopotamus amphibius kiboko]XP_057593551.1 uncharacterized protein C10orf143 homolog isoform X2 [Hippopotamus amphibius kiboko]XP_057593552.1 uncharacterized protein C10orf143 homolog isoform X2 [Hippopotamus amphibius kiboko]